MPGQQQPGMVQVQHQGVTIQQQAQHTGITIPVQHTGGVPQPGMMPPPQQPQQQQHIGSQYQQECASSFRSCVIVCFVDVEWVSAGEVCAGRTSDRDEVWYGGYHHGYRALPYRALVSLVSHCHSASLESWFVLTTVCPASTRRGNVRGVGIGRRKPELYILSLPPPFRHRIDSLMGLGFWSLSSGCNLKIIISRFPFLRLELSFILPSPRSRTLDNNITSQSVLELSCLSYFLVGSRRVVVNDMHPVFYRCA